MKKNALRRFLPLVVSALLFNLLISCGNEKKETNTATVSNTDSPASASPVNQTPVTNNNDPVPPLPTEVTTKPSTENKPIVKPTTSTTVATTVSTPVKPTTNDNTIVKPTVNTNKPAEPVTVTPKPTIPATTPVVVTPPPVVNTNPIPAKDPEPKVTIPAPGEWVVPAKDKNKVNPVKADGESIDIGRTLYMTNCASCHGKTGKGDGAKATTLTTTMVSLRLPIVQNQTDGSLFYKTREGRDEMPRYMKRIPNEEDIWHIINFMRTLK